MLMNFGPKLDIPLVLKREVRNQKFVLPISYLEPSYLVPPISQIPQ
jgi:hypothetical protein